MATAPLKELTDCPIYKQAADVLAKMESDRRTLNAEIAQLRLDRQESLAAARATAADDLVARYNGLPTPKRETSDTVKLIDDKLRTLHNLDEAIHKQKVTVGRARVEASKKIVTPAVVGQHRKLVVTLAESLVAAARAAEVLVAFQTDFDERGVVTQGSIHPMSFGRIGRLNDPQSFVCLFLAESVSHGLLTGKEDWLKGVTYK